MKFIIKNLFKLFFKFSHNIYGYKSSLKIKARVDRLYTFWISNEIYSFGKGASIGRDCYLLGGQYIQIGEQSSIGRHAVITCWDTFAGEKFIPSIKIGKNCSIGQYCHITSINSIYIGDNVLMGRRVTITDNSHGNLSIAENKIPPSKRKLYSKGPVIIGDNVWIGDKVSIMAGITIGNGAIIGANAVITKDVSPDSVVGGIPAKVIKVIK